MFNTRKRQTVNYLQSLIRNSIYITLGGEIASVIPLHKGGDINDPHDYRSISILPTLSKVFEKHTADKIHSYFLKTDVIHTSQSGFR